MTKEEQIESKALVLVTTALSILKRQALIETYDMKTVDLVAKACQLPQLLRCVEALRRIANDDPKEIGVEGEVEYRTQVAWIVREYESIAEAALDQLKPGILDEADPAPAPKQNQFREAESDKHAKWFDDLIDLKEKRQARLKLVAASLEVISGSMNTPEEDADWAVKAADAALRIMESTKP